MGLLKTEIYRFKIKRIYRVTQKGWDFTDDCTVSFYDQGRTDDQIKPWNLEERSSIKTMYNVNHNACAMGPKTLTKLSYGSVNRKFKDFKMVKKAKQEWESLLFWTKPSLKREMLKKRDIS